MERLGQGGPGRKSHRPQTAWSLQERCPLVEACSQQEWFGVGTAPVPCGGSSLGKCGHSTKAEVDPEGLPRAEV